MNRRRAARGRRVVAGCGVLAALVLALAPPATATAADKPKGSEAAGGSKATVEVGSGLSAPYLTDHPLDAPAPDITHAVIAVHGAGRNAASSFSGMRDTARTAGQGDQTLVIAPHFQTSKDSPGKGEVTWADDAWKEGGDSEGGSVSSFDVMDKLLDLLGNRTNFPNLERITIAGHSAGGQVSQRYAAGGKALDRMDQLGITVDFAPANASSYLHFTPDRANGDRVGKPANASSCPGYDNYKYGLQNRVRYMADSSAEDLIRRYTTHHVTLLSGDSDNQQDEALDDDCAAFSQGENRFERSQNFATYVKHNWPDSLTDRVVVPGIAHDRAGMFGSAEARPVLFGDTPKSAPRPGPARNKAPAAPEQRTGPIIIVVPARAVAPPVAQNQPVSQPLALIHRSEPLASKGDAEAAAQMLRQSPFKFRVQYVGLDNPLTAELLSKAALFVQPGGEVDTETAKRDFAKEIPLVNKFVADGGRYLGICAGGFVAGKEGYDVFPGEVGSYVGSPNSQAKNDDNYAIQIIWRDGSKRTVDFQDGNYFDIPRGTPAVTVMATYTNGLTAAAVATKGRGKAAFIGPHFESAPDDAAEGSGTNLDLGFELLDVLMQ